MLRVTHWSRRRRLWWALVFSWFSIGFWSVVWHIDFHTEQQWLLMNRSKTFQRVHHVQQKQACVCKQQVDIIFLLFSSVLVSMVSLRQSLRAVPSDIPSTSSPNGNIWVAVGTQGKYQTRTARAKSHQGIRTPSSDAFYWNSIQFSPLTFPCCLRELIWWFSLVTHCRYFLLLVYQMQISCGHFHTWAGNFEITL